jgi:DNA-binding transcriptional MerR regulator
LRTTLLVGELAARSGRSVHAIRWYDAQGLIPGVVRDGGGRRVFTERHVDWLALLDRLRSTGMSVADIRRYAALVRQGRAGVPGQHELLAAHRTRVAIALAEWQAALELLDGKLAFYKEWLATGERPASEVRKSATMRNAPKRRR